MGTLSAIEAGSTIEAVGITLNPSGFSRFRHQRKGL
jgi:hypothetical protein